jgi:hypothetical protein
VNTLLYSEGIITKDQVAASNNNLNLIQKLIGQGGFEGIVENYLNDQNQRLYELFQDTRPIESQYQIDEKQFYFLILNSALSRGKKSLRVQIQFKFFYFLLFFTDCTLKECNFFNERNLRELQNSGKTELTVFHKPKHSKIVHLAIGGKEFLNEIASDIDFFFSVSKFIFVGSVYPEKEHIYNRSVITRMINTDIQLVMTNFFNSKEEGFNYTTTSFHFRKKFQYEEDIKATNKKEDGNT